MAQQTPNDAICRYLEDAIAAEQNFESTLRANAKEADYPQVKALFEQHADETRRQHERLSARLTELGGKPSGVKSFLAHMFGMAPKMAQLGHDDAEKSTQDLVMAYSVEHSEMAMYQALIQACEAAGDTVTAQLARDIQAEERRTAELIWSLLPTIAADSFAKVTGMGVTTAGRMAA